MRLVPARASVANVPRIELAVLAEREAPFSVPIDVGEPRKVRSRPSCEAWPSARARRRLKTLVQWLERNGEDGAAASLREGLEETLTVLKFDLPAALRGFLLTTIAVENPIGSVRRVARNVTRWRSDDRITRWSALGVFQAEQNFRRIRGYRHLPLLAHALRRDALKIDQTGEAA